MATFREWIARLLGTFRPAPADRDLEEELRLHVELAAEDARRSGAGRVGERAARMRAGGVAQAMDELRDQRGFPWLEALWRDTRQAARALRRSPVLLATSTLSLGIGIGVNALLYMSVMTIYRHHPTMAEPARVVGVEPGNANQFSYPDYDDLVRSGIFSGVVGFRSNGFNLGSADGVRPTGVMVVTPNFFDVLGGTQARLGRTFSANEAAVAAEPRVAVLTDEFWRDLGGSPDIVGSPLVLNGQSFVVVGVLPPDYRSVSGWMGPGIYVPVSRLALPTIEERGSPSLTVMARLAEGTTREGVQSAVTALGASLERAYPERDEGMGKPASVFPAEAVQFRGTPAQFFLVASLLWGSVVLVLVIACVNVSGLLLARAATRRSEIAIRISLGAGRARVVQAMLVESFLLVLAGTAAGLLFVAGFGWLPYSPVTGTILDAIQWDGRLFWFSLLAIASTTLLCGLVPAIRATRADMVGEIRHGGTGATPGMTLRQGIVVGQVALSLMLIVFALLCVRSQIYIGTVDLGFDVDHGVVATFYLADSQYQGQERVRFAERVLATVEQVPGVARAGVADVIPLGGDSLVKTFHPAGLTDIPGARPSIFSVGPGYFQSLGIQFVRGRDFDVRDVMGSPAVAIVNETFARTHLAGQQIPARIQIGGEPNSEVIGLVRDNKIGTIGEAAEAVVYYPYAQRPKRLVVHARTVVDPDTMVTAIRRAARSVDGMVPVSVQTRRSAASLELTMRWTGTVLIGSIGAAGLLLTMVGLYGVMAYVAASRTAEVAIRMALGASPGRVRWEILSRSFAMVAAGVALGGAAALGLTPGLRTFLVGISPFDSAAFGMSAILLAVAGLAAGVVPAIRASRTDPMRALRQQ